MKTLNNLQDLLLNEVQILYDGKNQMQKALPGLQVRAESNELRKVLRNYEFSNDEQLNKIENVIISLNGNIQERVRDDATEKLLKRIDQISISTSDHVRDAALISTIQKVNHLDIAECGTICAYANTLKLKEVARWLHDNLEEEKYIDRQLSDIAENSVNLKALELTS